MFINTVKNNRMLKISKNRRSQIQLTITCFQIWSGTAAIQVCLICFAALPLRHCRYVLRHCRCGTAAMFCGTAAAALPLCVRHCRHVLWHCAPFFTS